MVLNVSTNLVRMSVNVRMVILETRFEDVRLTKKNVLKTLIAYSTKIVFNRVYVFVLYHFIQMFWTITFAKVRIQNINLSFFLIINKMIL